jgi:hypothetical protein
MKAMLPRCIFPNECFQWQVDSDCLHGLDQRSGSTPNPRYRMRNGIKDEVVITGTSSESIRERAVEWAKRLRGLVYRKASSITRPLGPLYFISNEGAPITSTVALKNPPHAQ